MTSALIVRRVTLGVGHLRTGNVRHYGGGKLLSTPMSLMVVEFGPGQYNLIHLDEDGQEMTDTFHESVTDALSQAEIEFRVKPTEWRTTEEAYR